MNINQRMSQFPEFKYYSQPALFEFGGTSTGQLELLPQLWYAAETLTSPNPSARRAALEFIIDQRAARLSPLITYLVFTRIDDADIKIRELVILTLASIFELDEEGDPAPDDVRLCTYNFMQNIGKNKIVALLEAVEFNPDIQASVGTLLSASTSAGNRLAEILLDRDQSLKKRELAAFYIGSIGFLDAEASLKRLAVRLESKIEGQGILPFTNRDHTEEILLLPTIRTALDCLQAP